MSDNVVVAVVVVVVAILVRIIRILESGLRLFQLPHTAVMLLDDRKKKQPKTSESERKRETRR